MIWGWVKNSGLGNDFGFDDGFGINVDSVGGINAGGNNDLGVGNTPVAHNDMGIDNGSGLKNDPGADAGPAPDDERVAGVASATTIGSAARQPEFWGGVGGAISCFFSFVMFGTDRTSAGITGALWPSPTGGRPQSHIIAGTDATFQIHSDSLQVRSPSMALELRFQS